MIRKKMIEAAGIPQPLFTMDEISEHVRVYYVRCVPLTSEAVSIVKGLPGIGDASLVLGGHPKPAIRGHLKTGQ